MEIERKGKGGKEDRENSEQNQQDPDRAMERVMDPEAVPGLMRTRIGDSATCSESAAKRRRTRAPGTRVC